MAGKGIADGQCEPEPCYNGQLNYGYIMGLADTSGRASSSGTITRKMAGPSLVHNSIPHPFSALGKIVSQNYVSSELYILLEPIYQPIL